MWWGRFEEEEKTIQRRTAWDFKRSEDDEGWILDEIKGLKGKNGNKKNTEKWRNKKRKEMESKVKKREEEGIVSQRWSVKIRWKKKKGNKGK